MIVLGFDFGQRHIGVAVGQTITGTASPLTTVRPVSAKPDWQSIGALISQWKPDALVVGDPLNMDGTEQEMTRAARRFANQLRGRFHLPVHSADERLSTREARDRMYSTGPGAKDDHGGAAQVILETWLGEQPATQRATQLTKRPAEQPCTPAASHTNIHNPDNSGST
ncbi:MAG: putative Holliday junction resolvase [Gammaproteobacteria bacterium]|jgi:putative Holliday junction resolvase